MEAGSQPPDEKILPTKDHPILLSPDTQSDAEMIGRSSAAPAANPAESTSSSSAPTGRPAPRHSSSSKPVPASAAPTQNSRPTAPSRGGGGGRIPPAENKERTTQATVPSTTAAQTAPRIPSAAAVQPRPSLSQQVSTAPAAPPSSVATTQPHAPLSQMTAPAPSPANHTARASSHISPPHHPAPTQNNGSQHSLSEPSSHRTASPAPVQYNPFREPHTPSALDPYTMENLFTNGGYHLPDANDSQLSPEAYVDQCNRLYAVVRTMHPSVVRRIIRDTWQSSLVGSEPHISFVMNVVTHKCSSVSARVAISKFGKDFVNHAKWEIMSQFTPALLAETEDLVVEKAPDSLLDKAMAKRLGTISARSLLNMLARAERLGYDESDIIDENTSSVSKPTDPSGQGVPNNYTMESTVQPASWTQPPPQSQPPPQPQPQPQPQTVDTDPLVCPLCHKRYLSQATRDHHFKKKVCQKPPAGSTYVCPRCDQSFATKAGFDYHEVNKVCGGDDGATSSVATASPNVMASSAGSSPASFTPAQMPSQPPPTQVQTQRAEPGPSASTSIRPLGPNTPHTAGAPAKVTPVHPPRRPQATPKPKSTPPPVSQTSPYDPYAHLSKEKHDMMDRELRDAEVSYGARMEEVRHTITDPILQTKKLDSLKNSFATKQSIIRKKYGVRLRERRSRAAIEEERNRMRGISPLQGSQAAKARTPPGSANTHASKKARGKDGQAVPTQRTVQETPTRKHAASADVAAPMSGGLAASAAAPEIDDPTKLGEAARRSEYNGGSYRAAPYPSSSQGAPPPSTPAKPTSNSPMKAILLQPPGVMADETDSDTDSDDDTIPAQLPPPPPRPSQRLGRPAR